MPWPGPLNFAPTYQHIPGEWVAAGLSSCHMSLELCMILHHTTEYLGNKCGKLRHHFGSDLSKQKQLFHIFSHPFPSFSNSSLSQHSIDHGHGPSHGLQGSRRIRRRVCEAMMSGKRGCRRGQIECCGDPFRMQTLRHGEFHGAKQRGGT